MREARVEKCEVGVDKVREAQILSEDFVEDEIDFLDHRRFENVVVFRVEHSVGQGGIDRAEP